MIKLQILIIFFTIFFSFLNKKKTFKIYRITIFFIYFHIFVFGTTFIYLFIYLFIGKHSTTAFYAIDGKMQNNNKNKKNI